MDDITEILLKMALKTIGHTLTIYFLYVSVFICYLTLFPQCTFTLL